MFFWNSLAFSMIQRMLAIWSLIPLPFLNPAWTSGSFSVHVLLKPGLENFERYFTKVWDGCNCAVVWTITYLAFLWDWNENWPFPVLWPLLSFPNLLACWVQHIHSSSFRIWNSSNGIPSPPLSLFVVMLPRPTWLCIPGCLALGYLGHEDLFFVQFCVFLPYLLNIICFC